MALGHRLPPKIIVLPRQSPKTGVRNLAKALRFRFAFDDFTVGTVIIGDALG
jgi:hypothetical protein